MKSRDILTVNVNLDWRILAVLVATGGLLIFAYSAVSAQSDEPPDVNSVQAEPAENLPQLPPVTVPDPPGAQDGDLVFTANEEWVPRDTVGPAPSSETRAAGIIAQSTGDRHFYLTDADYYADQAKTACASGYHMASLWEILDVSNLTYDYEHPLAHTRDDSGFGPPSDRYGWARTGQDSSGSSTTGTGNCLTWSSRSSSDSGAAVRLSSTWETDPGDIFTWDATSRTCDVVARVWCVQD